MAEFNTGDMAAGTSVPLDPDGKPCAVICTFEVECFGELFIHVTE